MEMDKHLDNILHHERFPRSNRYDPLWIIENQMGLNPLWLTEWVCEKIPLQPDMRVLDLGCGKALSSIFLAREYSVRVWAVDLLVNPTENFERICQAGVESLVYPIQADARGLPFAEAYFDVVISTDAYIYFGTDDLYLENLHRFVKSGGRIGISVPGFIHELEGRLPEHILPFWAQECWTWHTIEWWRWHWERTELVDVQCVDTLAEGGKLWLQWKKARKAAGDTSPHLESDILVLEADQGKYMGFIRMVAKRR